MIVCEEEFNKEKVLSLAGDIEGMKEYVISLIDPIYRHSNLLISNQLFYINQCILRDKSIPLDKKVAVSDTLVADVQVCGYLDTVTFMKTVERLVDYNKLYELYKKDKEKL